MRTKTLLAVAAGVLACAAWMPAQKMDLKLGLWEATTKTETSGMPAMPAMDMSKMPPDLRARIEAMMKAKQAGGPQTHTIKSCLTQEMLEKGLFKGEEERDTTCKRTIISSGSTSQHMKIECSGKQKMSGEATFAAQSRESVNGTIKITSGEGPNPLIINSTISAKWLGTACGDVK